MSHFDSSHPPNLTAPTATRLPKSFDLIIRQQPVHSRMCGVGERVDRRPIDPPPIVQLKLIGQSSDEVLQFISPYIFLVAVLVPADDQDDAHLHVDFHSRLTIGRTVSSLYLLRDLDNTEGAFFVFSDISVRADGHYRLRMCLFEIVESGVHYRRGVLTDPFTVYSAKKFPGMHLSCPLARHFAQQGLKIRIRKESRKRSTGSRRYSRQQDDDDDVEDSSSESRPGFLTRESDESYSSVNDSPAVEESRPTTLAEHGAHYSTASSSSSVAYRRVSNDSSTGKMLRLVASDPTPGMSADPQVYERPRIQQGIGTSSRVRLVDLLHPSLPDNPTFDDNEQVMSSVTPVSSFTSITGEALQYQPMNTRQVSRTEVAPQTSSELYWRLPPITYDEPTNSSSSPSTILYEQPQRNELLRQPHQYENLNSIAPSSNPSMLSHNHPLHSSPSNPNTVITTDFRPDRPEIILHGEPMLTNRPPQENLVLPSLREHLGELAVAPREDKSSSKMPEQSTRRR